MSRIIKFFRVLRRNPKKSILFSALFGYGINFSKNKYEEKLMMRAFCEEAMVYGECSKPLGESERHVTVLLNPAAKGGKGKTQFEHYCAPLLHLAGIKVATVKTEHEGQARDLMEIMENTSAVVVAGGDGTLGEGSEQEAPPKPVYAASMVEWGAYRDAAERNDVYWYWSVLKKYMVYVFSSYKDISWDCSAEVEYSSPCSGCSRCRGVTALQDTKRNKTPEPPKRWWMAYVPKPKPAFGNKSEVKVDYSSIINEECGVKHKTNINNICDLVITTRNTKQSSDIPSYALHLKTGPANVGTFDFIKEGWSREWNKLKSYASETTVGEVTLRPTGDVKTATGTDRELNIDSEAFEVRPMKIRAIPSAVTIFAPASPPVAAHVG
ncbi:Acylglycerol kinase-like [Homarus americanus]|uniref:Acylglycerol kinase, mitochondrial n=1 Tax=Homarus americanus TaxID=6706 RepID=A0A8J5JVQ5_HOMAM|nr:Acylglycerol kinase-like [Homarus americanus]